MRIYLIGYMGSGKSTLAKKLAKRLNMQSIDMDKYIEGRNCKSIAEIFAECGEETFRKKEQCALYELSQFTDIVIATGGGAPTFQNNMEIMNQTGVTIFIDVPETELVNRLINSPTERPLIKGKSKEELKEFIDSNLSERRVFYDKAVIVYKSDLETIDDLVNKIKDFL